MACKKINEFVNVLSIWEEAERLGISGVWPQRRATPSITGRPAHRLRPLPTARCPLHPLVGRTAPRSGLTRSAPPCAMEFTPRHLHSIPHARGLRTAVGVSTGTVPSPLAPRSTPAG